MIRLSRHLIPTALLWLGAATITYLAVEPDPNPVGLRLPPPTPHDLPGLDQANLDDARLLLEATSLWGLQRNGQPPPPPSTKIVPEDIKVVWKVLGSALRKKERYLIVQIESNPPIQIKEGEDLPDGSKLLKVLPKGYQTQSPDGNKEIILTSP